MVWARRFAASFSRRFERCACHPLLLRKGLRGWNKQFAVPLIESPLIARGSLLQGGEAQAPAGPQGRSDSPAGFSVGFVC